MARKKKAKRKTTTAKKSRTKKTTAKRKKSTVRKTAARKKTARARKAAAKKAPARRPAAKPPARPSGAAKRPAQRPAAGRPAPSAPAQRAPSEERIGVVTHYFNHLSVATVRLEGATLRVGDTIRIHGHTTDFTQKVESLEVDHGAVDEVDPNDDFGLKVADHAREHDVVYRVRK